MNEIYNNGSVPLAERDISSQSKRQRDRRPNHYLLCPVHPEQRISSNQRRYYLHLLTPEELRQRGMNDKRARQVIQVYPGLVLHNEWLEELYCPSCCEMRRVPRHPAAKPLF
jgi:hypothetical protein